MNPPDPASPPGRRRTAFALAALWVFSAGLRVYLTAGSPFFDPGDPAGLYWSESALQYRYAAMAAAGEQIPAHDPEVQSPEGLRPWDELTLAMEPAVGWSYRLLWLAGARHPFHWHAAAAIASVAALSLFAVFSLGATLWRSRRAGLFAAAAWALCPASYLRGIAGFVLEDFALPLLLGGFAAAARAVEAKSGRAACLAGLFFFAALVSWHLSGFALALAAAGFAAAHLAFPEKRREMLWTLLALGAAMLLAGLLSPALRHKHFLASVAPVALFAYLLAQMPGLRIGTLARCGVAAALAAAALFALRATGFDRSGEYGNVHGLILAKIRWLGIKPDDPSMLSWEARSSWEGPFNSPEPMQCALHFGWLALFAAFGARPLAGLLRDPGRRAAGWLLAGYLAAFLPLYAAFGRMEIFLAPGLAVLAAGFLGREAGHPARASRAWIGAGFLAAAALFEGIKASATSIDYGRQPDQRPLLAWLRERTEPGATVLAPMALSPSIAAYAGRAVPLHSKFEARDIRDKVRAYTEALFRNEEAFAVLCEAWGVDYVVHDARDYLDRSKGSLVYRAAVRRVPEDAAILFFQRAPERLTRFRLVYQDGERRVFRLVSPGGGA